MSDARELTVDAAGRLDRFLAGALPHASRRLLRQVAADGRVRVNGKLAGKGAYVRPGDVVSVPDELVTQRTLQTQADLAAPILYCDDHLFALDKPEGMPSVARNFLDNGTVANFLAARFPETSTLERGGLEAGLVHRLDTATSGVLVGARTPSAYSTLRSSFGGSGATKTYRAVVHGAIEAAGVAATPIRSRPADRARVEVVTDPGLGGRPATTRFRPLRRSASATSVEIEIESGVRHQIRAHLASIGHPIVGDELYGATPAPRLFLHALSVTFSHPDSGTLVTIESPLPEAFDQPFENDWR